MLDEDIFYKDNSSKVIDCSGFWPITPFGLPTQKDRSNDSGIWVASWMKECNLNDDFEIHVSDSTRMRLAVDLVLKEYNDLSPIIEMMLQSLRACWKKSTKISRSDK
ncbi:hypothetical protein PIB30_084885 [Stylosanthes scabra]|uniref:Uncharacterized protein n=1 Tax=Stylosanthes scabra TaxID=79078 RepID=A0ABU6QTX1_9FABA|nr:hypothetical protein [Stylosanthes scabra]